MQDFVSIGPVPSDEECAQVGVTEDYAKWAMYECNAYIMALRKKYGDEPKGARLKIKSNPHDFGTYYDVICTFDGNDKDATEYAMKVEEGLTTWEEVGHVAPVKYGDHHRRAERSEQ